MWCDDMTMMYSREKQRNEKKNKEQMCTEYFMERAGRESKSLAISS